MTSNLKVTALLTGRGNNTLRDKNILPVFGKPLLYYPAVAAKQVEIIQNYFISSDCIKILSAASALGFEKIIRPAELAMHDSLHSDVIDHALSQMNQMGYYPDILIVLLANTVMVKKEWIEDCINEIMKDETLSAVVPVYKEMDHHPFRAKQLNEDGLLVPFFDFSNKNISSNRNDLPDCFFLSHNFWVLNLKSINKAKGYAPWKFMGEKVKPYLVEEAFDVHSIADLKICELWLQENGLRPDVMG